MFFLENSYPTRPRRLMAGDLIIGGHNLFGLEYCPVIELVKPTYILIRHPVVSSTPTVIIGEKH